MPGMDENILMPTNHRCQSCGMPLGDGFYGTEADGGLSAEYCRYCYQEGSFTMPELTLKDAVRFAAEHLRKERGMEEDEAEVMANATIPSLRRWRSAK